MKYIIPLLLSLTVLCFSQIKDEKLVDAIYKILDKREGDHTFKIRHVEELNYLPFLEGMPYSKYYMADIVHELEGARLAHYAILAYLVGIDSEGNAHLFSLSGGASAMLPLFRGIEVKGEAEIEKIKSFVMAIHKSSSDEVVVYLGEIAPPLKPKVRYYSIILDQDNKIVDIN